MTRYISLAEYLWLAEQVTGVAARDLASPFLTPADRCPISCQAKQGAGMTLEALLSLVLICRLRAVNLSPVD